MQRPTAKQLEPWEPHRKGRSLRTREVESITRIQNQQSQAHRGSYRLKQQSQNLHRSALDLLCICYGCVAWCSYETPNVGNGEFLTPLQAPLWDPFPSFCVASSSLNMMMVCVWSYHTLLFYLHLISFGDLLFFEGKRKKGWGRWGWKRGETAVVWDKTKEIKEKIKGKGFTLLMVQNTKNRLYLESGFWPS